MDKIYHQDKSTCYHLQDYLWRPFIDEIIVEVKKWLGQSLDDRPNVIIMGDGAVSMIKKR